jgi:hypothetical protein
MDKEDAAYMRGVAAGVEAEQRRIVVGSVIYSEGHSNPGVEMEDLDGPAKAKAAVKRVIDGQAEAVGKEPPTYELYVVTFSYILGCWKALVATDTLDGSYYEVTYNKARQETYVDVYGKRMNVVIQDR